ncbi:phosphatase PAP2 family protein [Amycolatopsis sp. NPDC049252]|uniref:phosphatase PAP2 family protein n=1 Tax=Amycolatopsis sp. NPDC049252 TaxID=3363933 RepID=UPI003719AD70
MDGGAIDGSWYLAVLGFARETPWLQGVMAIYTNVGLVLLALLAVMTWWRMRSREGARMAAALWVTLAVAAALALLFATRRTGLVALGLALLVAFSRMYLGAHYPHDVLAGAVLGALVACLGLSLRRPMTALVDHLRDGALRPLVGSGGRTLAAAR